MKIAFPLAIIFVAVAVRGHNHGAHLLEGDPGPIPSLPEITGAFEIKVIVEFADLTAAVNQTVLEFSNAQNQHVIWFGQDGASTDLRLQIGSTNDALVASSAIMQGSKSTFRVGVDGTGTGYLFRDGVELPAVKTPTLPANVPRSSKLLGKSMRSGYNGLHGSLIGIQVKNHSGGPSQHQLEHLRHWNIPGQTYGAFTISFHARFDNTALGTTNPVFDISDLNNAGSFVLLQSSGVDMIMTIKTSTPTACQNTCRLVWLDPVVEGEWALWHAGVDATGLMFLQKDGEKTGASRSSNGQHGLEPIPNNNYQHDIVVGELGDSRMEGVILGLRVNQHSTS